MHRLPVEAARTGLAVVQQVGTRWAVVAVHPSDVASCQAVRNGPACLGAGFPGHFEQLLVCAALLLVCVDSHPPSFSPSILCESSQKLANRALCPSNAFAASK